MAVGIGPAAGASLLNCMLVNERGKLGFYSLDSESLRFMRVIFLCFLRCFVRSHF